MNDLRFNPLFPLVLLPLALALFAKEKLLHSIEIVDYKPAENCLPFQTCSTRYVHLGSDFILEPSLATLPYLAVGLALVTIALALPRAFRTWPIKRVAICIGMVVAGVLLVTSGLSPGTGNTSTGQLPDSQRARHYEQFASYDFLGSQTDWSWLAALLITIGFSLIVLGCHRLGRFELDNKKKALALGGAILGPALALFWLTQVSAVSSYLAITDPIPGSATEALTAVWSFEGLEAARGNVVVAFAITAFGTALYARSFANASWLRCGVFVLSVAALGFGAFGGVSYSQPAVVGADEAAFYLQADARLWFSRPMIGLAWGAATLAGIGVSEGPRSRGVTRRMEP